MESYNVSSMGKRVTGVDNELHSCYPQCSIAKKAPLSQQKQKRTLTFSIFFAGPGLNTGQR